MRILALLLAGVVAAPAVAHDFWVQPKIFAVPAGGVVPLTIEVGHAQFRQRWSVSIDRVATFTTIGPDGVVDHRGELHLDTGDSDADLRFAKPGTYIIALTTSHASSILPAIRFNDYINYEGITPAIATRAAAGTTNTPGREIYSRRAKALIQVGTPTARQSVATKPIGLSLEIVPERDPYTLGPDEALPVRILYDGKPLAGAFVKLTNLDFDAKPVRTQRSDAAGRAAFKIPFRGLWQMNVIWTRPLVGNADADFDTTFSSLTFGTLRPGQAVEAR